MHFLRMGTLSNGAQTMGRGRQVERTAKGKEDAVERWGGRRLLDFHRSRFCMD